MDRAPGDGLLPCFSQRCGSSILPLRRRISDVQVAQFIEERFPQLQDRLVTAVEYGGSASGSGMIDLVSRDALEHVRPG